MHMLRTVPGRARPRLKPIHDQVVVILGASSGIGRLSARMLAARGALVVVAARSEPALASLVDEIVADGGEAVFTTCDVTDPVQVEAVADLAIERFGRIDTWVNVAGVGAYARFEDLPLDDFRRVLDVNLMGYVHGARAALPHLRREGRGALIMVSSVEATVGFPLQSAYVVSKHAVEGLVETLRRELRAEGVPIAVTSVKPAAIDTPFFANARTHLGYQPTVPPPVYHPEVVARCVLHAASHPERDLYAGGSAKAAAMLQAIAPQVVDRAMSRLGVTLQETGDPPGGDAVDAARPDEGRVTGGMSRRPTRFSPWTWLETHPRTRAAMVTGLAVAALPRLARR